MDSAWWWVSEWPAVQLASCAYTLTRSKGKEGGRDDDEGRRSDRVCVCFLERGGGKKEGGGRQGGREGGKEGYNKKKKSYISTAKEAASFLGPPNPYVQHEQEEEGSCVDLKSSSQLLPARREEDSHVFLS